MVIAYTSMVTRAAAFGSNDDEKAISAKVVEAIKSALESAGK